MNNIINTNSRFNIYDLNNPVENIASSQNKEVVSTSKERIKVKRQKKKK
jgi:hypothetical protein